MAPPSDLNNPGAPAPAAPKDEQDEVLHDLNNVLSVILASAEWIAAALEPGSELRGDVEEILTAARRGAALTLRMRPPGPGAPPVDGEGLDKTEPSLPEDDDEP